ncbi:hypothetical protein JZ751_005155 [Albula glossodonta]|uniref:Uncharacterized protein n=1 Tax=Albula glossodonta TaxID=121402 RepID=A0A8T2P4V3_9TELE|nr:hypothetical protein JZ751_005155 [Albula glossodonta]
MTITTAQPTPSSGSTTPRFTTRGPYLTITTAQPTPSSGSTTPRFTTRGPYVTITTAQTTPFTAAPMSPTPSLSTPRPIPTPNTNGFTPLTKTEPTPKTQTHPPLNTTMTTDRPTQTPTPNMKTNQTSPAISKPKQTTTPILYSTTPTAIIPPQTTGRQAEFELKMSFTINQDFTESLTDPTSADYMGLSQTISNAVDENYRKIMRGYIGVTITGFRSGSVITDFIIRTDNITSSVIQTANAGVATTLKQQNIPVDENSFRAAVIVDGFSDASHVFSGDEMILACEVLEQFKKFPANWKVNSTVIKNDNTKYTINTSPPRLIVQNVVERDSGEYECFVEDEIVVFIRKDNIVVRRAIVMLTRSRINVPCITENVEVECCVKPDGFPAMWTENGKKLEPVQESTVNGLKCYKHNYATNTQNDGCVTRSLICTMTVGERTFTQKAEINFFQGQSDCDDDVYGSGKQGSLSTTGCPEGYEGNRTARCDSNTWKLVEDNCVLSVIIDLKIQSEILTKDDVSDFVDRLSKVTKEQEEEIVDSPGNIVTIVEILANVANASEAVTQKVMAVS